MGKLFVKERTQSFRPQMLRFAKQNDWGSGVAGSVTRVLSQEGSCFFVTQAVVMVDTGGA